MDFLKELLSEELFAQLEKAINEHNGNEANKDKQIKLANLGTGEYVGKGKYEALNAQLQGKNNELEQANGLIEEFRKASKGNEELQGKIGAYETKVTELQQQLAEAEMKYAFEVLLMDAGVKDKEAREFLTFKYEKKLKEEGKTLELDESKRIKGGEEIITSLKTSNPAQFDSASGEYKVYGNNRLPDGDKDRNVEPKSLAEALAQKFENK